LHDIYLQQLPPSALLLRGDISAWIQFLRDDSGQDLIEYVLVAALIALGALTTIRGLGGKIAETFNSLASNVTSNT
jgi:pilus assembly protein Flp/PilA